MKFFLEIETKYEMSNFRAGSHILYITWWQHLVFPPISNEPKIRCFRYLPKKFLIKLLMFLIV